MYDRILVRYGDLTLKGKNKRLFVRKAVSGIQEKVNNPHVEYEKNHDRLYIKLNDQDVEPIIDSLHKVAGLASFSLVARTEQNEEAMNTLALALINKHVKKDTTFKVDTKRADKTFLIESMDVSRRVAGHLLRNCDHLSVDIKNPDLTLSIEIRRQGVYMYTEKIKGMGGFPVGIAGKGLLMTSGGIDSPVAGYLAMKQGVEIELFHFESTPLTSIESAQKVIDIAKKLAVYAPGNKLIVHMVPFKDLHTELLEYVPEPYHITIMRRMMYRLASRFAMDAHIPILINGESIGQVASQTLESIQVVNAVTNLPIIRPLATLDKLDIIAISKQIDTYKTSIKPFEDCCTVYVPKSPTTRPRNHYAERYERLFDYKTLVENALQGIKTITIESTSTVQLENLGFTVSEALKEA